MSESEDKPEDAVAKMLADTMPLPEPGTDPLAYRAQLFLYKHLRYDSETQKHTLTVAFNDLLVGFAREEAGPPSPAEPAPAITPEVPGWFRQRLSELLRECEKIRDDYHAEQDGDAEKLQQLVARYQGMRDICAQLESEILVRESPAPPPTHAEGGG